MVRNGKRMISPKQKLALLFEKVKKCRHCYEGKKTIVPLPDPKNGTQDIKVLFLNERPGRLGAGTSGYISFENNDPTAEHFKNCFGETGLAREEVFITNACLCYPDIVGYRDAPPKAEYIRNCLYWLEKQIQILRPKLIVTCGNSALKAMKMLYADSESLRTYKLKRNIGAVISDTPVRIYPVYHTSARARITRRENEQLKDWRKIRRIVAEIQAMNQSC